jgi:DNA-binding protein HU-beta
MNKQELLTAIAESTSIPKHTIDRVLTALADQTRKSLKKGDEVKFHGLGTFAVANRAARTSRNPRSGEVVQVDAKRVPKFRPAKELKDSVN